MRTESKALDWVTTAALMLLILAAWGLAGAWDVEAEQVAQEQALTVPQDADFILATWDDRGDE